AYGIGLITDLKAVVNARTKDEIFQPSPERGKQYQIYTEIYEKLLKALHTLGQDVQRREGDEL
ncbi:MAG TPA: hypothetical protein IAA63_03395, partial [Candidatus Pullilachnospira stercoravium]|nr:hypothetical protein [Candidatus Pullilachnospira stercoravium]